MFWKKDNLDHTDQRSLSTKLMVLYTLSTLGILTAICLYLYPTFLTILSQLSGSDAALIKTQCYKNIIIALLFSSLGAIGLGKIIANNGLNRLREFTARIKRTSADSLHERIDINAWPNELKGLCTEFNLMLNRIQASFIQLNQFSSDIAHELRTPLNNLLGTTEVALTKNNLPAEYSKILESNLKEYHHLTRVVETLLFLARSDQRQLAVNLQLINASDEISKLIDYYQPIAEEQKITVTCEGDAPLLVDTTLFKRVINNLLSNSLKYTPANGTINFFIKPANSQWIEISIQDNGIGIEEKHIAKIFDRFYRVDSSRSSDSGGLGLGLAIVKSIVELHNGKISITSKRDVGTSIQMYFPCQANS